MGGTTPAPWSIPYPTGTDRVADGDNAIQAVADRLNVTLGALPRGYLAGGGWQSAATPISDNHLFEFPPLTFPTPRDLLFTFSGMQTNTAGTGIDYRILNKADSSMLLSVIRIMAPSSFAAGWSAALPLTVPAGTITFNFHAMGYGANGNTLTLALAHVFDMGATGAI